MLFDVQFVEYLVINDECRFCIYIWMLENKLIKRYVVTQCIQDSCNYYNFKHNTANWQKSRWFWFHNIRNSSFFCKIKPTVNFKFLKRVNAYTLVNWFSRSVKLKLSRLILLEKLWNFNIVKLKNLHSSWNETIEKTESLHVFITLRNF